VKSVSFGDVATVVAGVSVPLFLRSYGLLLRCRGRCRVFRVQHPRRKPDMLLVLYALVGVALLATLSVHYHLLERPAEVDPGHSDSDQRA